MIWIINKNFVRGNFKIQTLCKIIIKKNTITEPKFKFEYMSQKSSQCFSIISLKVVIRTAELKLHEHLEPKKNCMNIKIEVLRAHTDAYNIFTIRTIQYSPVQMQQSC